VIIGCVVYGIQLGWGCVVSGLVCWTSSGFSSGLLFSVGVLLASGIHYVCVCVCVCVVSVCVGRCVWCVCVCGVCVCVCGVVYVVYSLVCVCVCV